MLARVARPGSIVMIIFLRLLFGLILVSMLAVTSWAGSHTPLLDIPRAVLGHPWFIATLCDAYWGFVSFYVWVAWKEQSGGARVLWFVAIIALGNIAMAVYALTELFRVRADGALTDVIARRNPGRIALPATLALIGIAVYVAAAA